MSGEIVAVVGLGLIGGSVGGRLRERSIRVRGHDISPRHARRALELGLVDDVGHTLQDTVRGADVVLLAVPTLKTIDLLPRIDLACDAGALVLDTASAKRVITETMAVMVGSARMVGGHPIAGKETSGPDEASPALFEGKTFCLCPTEQTEAGAVERAREFAAMLGSVPVVLDAAEHDRVLAGTSHLPQVLSTVLAATVDAPAQLSGNGFRDMTRLAGSDSSLWRDVLLANSDEVARIGQLYQANLAALLDAIAAGDVSGIEEMFVAGRASYARREAMV